MPCVPRVCSLRSRAKAALHLSSSASIERFFFILKSTTSRKQFSECADTLELRGTLLYNERLTKDE